MLIGELSRRTGASPRMLRYYERQGLLTSRRHGNGYREFDEHAIDDVGRIRDFLQAGLPTDLIRDILPCANGAPLPPGACPELVARVMSVRDGLERQAARLESHRESLDRYLAAAAEDVSPGDADALGVAHRGGAPDLEHV